jgi:hypothetical protein
LLRTPKGREFKYSSLFIDPKFRERNIHGTGTDISMCNNP